jgi:hypothetical protein
MPAVLPINAASLQLQQRIDEYGQRLKQVSQELQAAGQLLHSYQRQLAGDQAACAAEAGAFTQQLQTAQQQLDAAQQQHADQQELVAGVLAEVSRMQTEQQQELALQLTASIMQTAALGLQQLGTVEETAAVIVQSLLTELGDSQLVLDSQRGLLRRLQQRYRQRQEDVLDLVRSAVCLQAHLICHPVGNVFVVHLCSQSKSLQVVFLRASPSNGYQQCSLMLLLSSCCLLLLHIHGPGPRC